MGNARFNEDFKRDAVHPLSGSGLRANHERKVAVRGLAMKAGVVIRRIYHASAKLTCRSYMSANLEQGSYCWAEEASTPQTRLGNPRSI